MGMEQRAFWQPFDNLPCLSLLNSFFGEIECNTGKYVMLMFVDSWCPVQGELTSTDLTNNFARLLLFCGQALPEVII